MDKFLKSQLSPKGGFKMGLHKGDMSYFFEKLCNPNESLFKKNNSMPNDIDNDVEKEFLNSINDFDDKNHEISWNDIDCDFIYLNSELNVIGWRLFYPTNWVTEIKKGINIKSLHTPVPGLNETIGESIAMFFNTLPADSKTVYRRSNIGFTQSGNKQYIKQELTDIEKGYLRIEEQSFIKLISGNIVFSIRIKLISFNEFISNKENAEFMFGFLTNMKKEIVQYKGLSEKIILQAKKLCEMELKK